MKILITGGAGYLGTVITKTMLEAGHNVTVVDNLSFKQLSPLHYTSNPNYNFIYGEHEIFLLFNGSFFLEFVRVFPSGILGTRCQN